MADEKTLTGRASIEAGSFIPGEGLQQTPAQKAAAGPRPEPKRVAMEVLRDGSFGGEYYHAGETLDAPEDQAETLTLAGFAARADRVQRAQEARDARERDAADAKAVAEKKGARRSTAVRPMGTQDVPGAEPPKKE